MARVTVMDCLEQIPNRFELVIVAAKRARQLEREGAESTVPEENDKPTVVALREIAKGTVTRKILEDGNVVKHIAERTNPPVSGETGETG